MKWLMIWALFYVFYYCFWIRIVGFFNLLCSDSDFNIELNELNELNEKNKVKWML